MKQFILGSMLLSAVAAYGQTGEVAYTRTIALGEVSVDGMPAELAAMLPKEDKADYRLFFTPQATLYEAAARGESEAKEISGEGFRIRLETGDDEDKFYTDIAAGSVVEQRQLSGRTFLINGDKKERKWKMTGNQKKLLDHVVMEAVPISAGDTITAWYAPDLPVASGPQGLTGLPGLILEATINTREVIQATAIRMDAAAAARVIAPGKGKKLTRGEFETLAKQKQEEQIQEMQTSGNGGKRIMIVR